MDSTWHLASTTQSKCMHRDNIRMVTPRSKYCILDVFSPWQKWRETWSQSIEKECASQKTSAYIVTLEIFTVDA